MRQSQSSKSGMPVAQIVWVGLMASVATGCSSDSSRFAGIFSKTDSMTTASTGGQITGLNAAPVPQADVDGGGGGYAASSGSMGGGSMGGGYNNRQQAMTQPYPAQTYSPARRASSVQKSELAPPSGSTASTGPISSRRQMASAAPFPSAGHQSAAAVEDDGDGMSTNTIAAPTKPALASQGAQGANGQGANGWSTVNAPRVVLKPGETIATLSQRYGVPEKEIVKANGLSTAAAARPGQSILIPTFGSRSTPTRAAAAEGTLLPPGQAPGPGPHQEEKVAVLPTNPKLRDKVKTDIAANNTTNAAGSGKTPPPAGSYVVKPGDSLAKIARENNVSVGALKQANNLGAHGVRVGQTLELPQADQKLAATPVSASPAAAKAEVAKAAPVTAAAPAAAAPTKSVTDVASADPGDKAPDATGIGKYRWPVRGAVVAPFGANVAGKRNDGIDISVPTGTPVKAAENGVVIYAGNGLKELGNTVLVRHDDGTVTVYGHADAISVQRGQKVQRGQQVATSGMSGNATQPTLHFEVRKDATPVNPMGFLE